LTADIPLVVDLWGCCDGSFPMRYPKRGEFKIGSYDVYFGEIANTPFFLAAYNLNMVAYMRLIIDVVPGRKSSFSLEATEGIRFLTR